MPVSHAEQDKARGAARSQAAATAAALPAWLTEPAGYEPPADREGWLRRNLLSLFRLLAVFDAERLQAAETSSLDRLCAAASPAVRLACLLALVVCVTAAKNLAFVWTCAALLLAALALEPLPRLRAALAPTLVAVGLAALVNLPAALLGQPAALARITSKTFVTAGAALLLAAITPVTDLARTLRLPATACLTVDLALRNLALLAQTATTLSEALALRSVGHDVNKTGSAAGVIGATFLRSQDLARAQAEAMACRGYNGETPASARARLAPADVALLAGTALLAAFFVYLEAAL